MRTHGSAPALAPFAEDWIGGNIRGLQALADTLDSYPPKITDAVAPAGHAVQQLVSPGGWQGTAAASFGTAWGRDSVAATALGTAIGDTAGIVGQLAATLAGIENALEQAAGQASQDGVPVGPDGNVAAARLTSAQQQTAAAYQSFRGRCAQDAQHARDQAADALRALYDEIAPGKILTADQYNTLADYLRSLWALPTGYRKFVDGKIPGMERAATKARISARENARLEDGRFGPWTEAGKQQFAAAKATLQSVEDQAKTAAAHENLSTKVMGSGLSDVVSGGEDWGKAARFFGDIPFAGEGLAAVGAGLTIAGDRAQGESWARSVSDGLTSNAAGLIAGEGAGDAFAAGAAGLAGSLGAGAAAAGVTGVAFGVVAGGVVAVGVGDFVHNVIQENWGADFHQHGVLGGLGHGTVDSLDNTRHDLASLAGATGHAVSHIWHSIF